MAAHVIPQKRELVVPKMNWPKIIKFVEKITRCRLVTKRIDNSRDLLPDMEVSSFCREIIQEGNLIFFHSEFAGTNYNEETHSLKIWFVSALSGIKKPVLVLWAWYEMPNESVDYGCNRSGCSENIHVAVNICDQQLPWLKYLDHIMAHKDAILAEQKKRMEAYRRQQREEAKDDETMRKYYGCWRLGLSEKAKFWGDVLSRGPDGNRMIKDKRAD